MRASQIYRMASKKARIPVTGPQGKGSKINIRENSSRKPPASSLPKRANPHLVNLQSEAPRRVPPNAIAFFSMGVLIIGVYGGSLYANYKREVAQSQSLQVPEDVSDRYNQMADTFDAEIDTSEKLMRMGKKRNDLIKMAQGDVLEVSCGTGRNVEYYDLQERRGVDEKGRAKLLGCRSVTFVDLSPQMVEVTRQKFQKLHPEYQKVAFRAQNAGEVMPTPAASWTDKNISEKESTPTKGPYFDTVVQTMGLCSMSDPVGVLRHLGSITEPQHGRILLLEHGRSHYGWLNRILDNLAPVHADKHGCWWNRDIGKIVEQSGLEVVEMKRWHFGTTWRFVLRPKGKHVEQASTK